MVIYAKNTIVINDVACVLSTLYHLHRFQGYITRSASGQLPPLDPFVDVDEEMKQPRNPSPRLLTRGVDLVQAYSNSHGAQACLGPQRAGAELLDSERSRSPIKNGTGQG